MITLIYILFSITAFLALFPPRKEQQKNFAYIFIGVCLLLLACSRDGSIVRDYDNYIEYFFASEQSEEILIEYSFILISNFVKAIFGYQYIYIFIIYAILGVSLKFIGIKKLSPFIFLSLCMYFSYFVLQEMTQMRVGVAAGFLLLCVKPIYDRDWKRFLLFAACSIFFHYSALVVLPLWFLDNKPRRLLMAISIPFGYVAYFLKVNVVSLITIPLVKDKIDLYLLLQESGENFSNISVISLVIAARIIFFYFLLWKLPLLQEKNKYSTILLKIYCLSIFIFPLLATMPAMANRVSELYAIVEIILLPFLMYLIKPSIVPIVIVILFGLRLLYEISFIIT